MGKATIKGREKEFRRLFQKTWQEWWRRAPEILYLARHNKTVKFFVKSVFRDPKIFLQMLFGGKSRA
jgi:hypothetical protein